MTKIIESVFNTYRKVGYLLNEISYALADRVASARNKQYMDAKQGLLSQEISQRTRGRARSKEEIKRGFGADNGPDHLKDRFDRDAQYSSARQGLSGEKDKGIAVPDSQRSGIERRHVPTKRDLSTGNDEGIKTRSNPTGETLIDKLSRRANRSSMFAQRKGDAQTFSRSRGQTPEQWEINQIRKSKGRR